MNRRRHPSVPLQQNTLWGHAPLLCVHYEEQTEPVYKGQLKCGWWWKGVHHKRKQIRPMNNRHQASSEKFWFGSHAVVIWDVAIAYRPGAESTDTPELLETPSFVFIAPGILCGELKTSNTTSWKRQKVLDMCSPLPSDPNTKARIDFMWTGSTPVRDHLPRLPPVAAMHPEQLGKDSGTLTGQYLINPASLSSTEKRFVRCHFLFRKSEGCFAVMLNSPPPPPLPKYHMGDSCVWANKVRVVKDSTQIIWDKSAVLQIGRL